MGAYMDSSLWKMTLQRLRISHKQASTQHRYSSEGYAGMIAGETIRRGTVSHSKNRRLERPSEGGWQTKLCVHVVTSAAAYKSINSYTSRHRELS